MQGFASIETQEHLCGQVLMLGDEVWLTQLSKSITVVFTGIRITLCGSHSGFSINLSLYTETRTEKGSILQKNCAAELATHVNFKWVSTCLWPCFVHQKYKGELSQLNLMICLMQSMPFHRSAAALALQASECWLVTQMPDWVKIQHILHSFCLWNTQYLLLHWACPVSLCLFSNVVQ